MNEMQILKCRLTAELLANIYSHVHEDTAEKVKRARAIAEEIIRQEIGETNEKDKAPGACL